MLSCEQNGFLVYLPHSTDPLLVARSLLSVGPLWLLSMLVFHEHSPNLLICTCILSGVARFSVQQCKGSLHVLLCAWTYPYWNTKQLGHSYWVQGHDDGYIAFQLFSHFSGWLQPVYTFPILSEPIFTTCWNAGIRVDLSESVRRFISPVFLID